MKSDKNRKIYMREKDKERKGKRGERTLVKDRGRGRENTEVKNRKEKKRGRKKEGVG